MSSKRQYAGAARYIEIAPPGIPFRAMVNVDHITSIIFQNKMEEIEIRDEGSTGTAEVLDDDGNVLQDAVSPSTHMEHRVTGFMIVVGVAGQQNEFTFSRPDVAIKFYYELEKMISGVGVPILMSKLRMLPPAPPPVPEEDGPKIVGANGLEIGEEGEDLEDPVIDDDGLPGVDDIIDEALELGEDFVPDDEPPAIN